MQLNFANFFHKKYFKKTTNILNSKFNQFNAHNTKIKTYVINLTIKYFSVSVVIIKKINKK